MKLPDDDQGTGTANFGAPMDEDSCAEPERLLPLPVAAAQVLETESWNTVPKLFSSLAQAERPLLMEITCEKEGVLARAVQQSVGNEQSAMSCSLWSQEDLGKAEGTRLVLEQIETLRPNMVWLSPPGRAYSPLQRTNQRSEAQKQELTKQRHEAMKVYVGCSVIWHFCVQHGIHVVWELAEKSDAWRLPIVQNILKQYNPPHGNYKGVPGEFEGPGGETGAEGMEGDDHPPKARRASPQTMSLRR